MSKPLCIDHDNYFSTPEFVITASHYLTSIALPITLFGSYCILFKTPSQLNSVKWLMLNLHIWCGLTDILMSFLGVPYLLLPSMSGYALGLIDCPGLFVYLLVTLLAGCAAGVVLIYENRYNQMFGHVTSWRKFRVLFIVSIYTVVPFIFIPPFFYIPDQEKARAYVFDMLPCYHQRVINDRKLFVLALDYWLSFICITYGTVLWTVLIATFFFLTVVKLWSVQQSLVSKATINMQKKFTSGVTLQTTFMFIIMLSPISVCIYMTFGFIHNQAVSNIAILIIQLHGVGNTLVMISVHKPYRTFIVSSVSFCRSKRNDVKPHKNSQHCSVLL